MAAISPTRAENYPLWYQEVIKQADLAENSPVRGCMIIKPYGYAIWEAIQQDLDRRFKALGHQNAYFPLLIPLSYLEKEAEHVEGFAKECAVVTHHRLEPGEDQALVPAGPLEEPLVIRPTSETMIGQMMSKWVQSYRDLPIKLNQWANVMRWEMRTRMFLRTSEFLWQEGHTAHASGEEAQQETKTMFKVYADFAKERLAMPVIMGEKTVTERFPGAENTYTIEAMMQDKKALQAGTSHYLGQNFSKAADIRFLDQEGKSQLAYTTSWGVSTRLIGGLIMSHSDDDGLVLPPSIAPYQIVVMPIYRNDEEKAQVMPFCKRLEQELQSEHFQGAPLRLHIDDRPIRGGDKNWQWIKKGVPIRIEVGPRDIAKGSVFVAQRHLDPKDKQSFLLEDFVIKAAGLLVEMQRALYRRAKDYREENTIEVANKADFEAFFKAPKNEKTIYGGFVKCYALDDENLEQQVAHLKVSPRCILLDQEGQSGTCIFSGKETKTKILFARAY